MENLFIANFLMMRFVIMQLAAQSYVHVVVKNYRLLIYIFMLKLKMRSFLIREFFSMKKFILIYSFLCKVVFY